MNNTFGRPGLTDYEKMACKDILTMTNGVFQSIKSGATKAICVPIDESAMGILTYGWGRNNSTYTTFSICKGHDISIDNPFNSGARDANISSGGFYDYEYDGVSYHEMRLINNTSSTAYFFIWFLKGDTSHILTRTVS